MNGDLVQKTLDPLDKCWRCHKLCFSCDLTSCNEHKWDNCWDPGSRWPWEPQEGCEESQSGWCCQRCRRRRLCKCSRCGKWNCSEATRTCDCGLPMCNDCNCDCIECASCLNYYKRNDLHPSACQQDLCNGCFRSHRNHCLLCQPQLRQTTICACFGSECTKHETAT